MACLSPTVPLTTSCRTPSIVSAICRVPTFIGDPNAGLDPETVIWRDRGISLGASPSDDSIEFADDLIVAIKDGTTYANKITYLLPFLGDGLIQARVPLRDLTAYGGLDVGISDSHGFVGGDFSEAVGLTGDGATKRLETLISINQLGSGATSARTGGMGMFICATGASVATEYTCGAINSPTNSYYIFRFSLSEPSMTFSWGDFGNGVVVASSPTRGHYYGQRSSAILRKFFKDGVSLGTNTSNDGTNVASVSTPISVFAWHGSLGDNGNYADDTLGYFYLTDGTMTDQEVTDFHTLLNTYLITPTGR